MNAKLVRLQRMKVDMPADELAALRECSEAAATTPAALVRSLVHKAVPGRPAPPAASAKPPKTPKGRG
jgi:hypothetical protein